MSAVTVISLVVLVWLFDAYKPPIVLNPLPQPQPAVDLKRWRHDGSQPTTDHSAPWPEVEKLLSII